MNKFVLSLGLSTIAWLAACSGNGGKDGGGGGAGGGTGGGAVEPFGVTVLDPDGGEPTYFAMAYDAQQERVGVVYFVPRGTETNVGHPDYNLNYVEWKQGVVSPVETLRYVQRMAGVSLAFNPTTGEPVASYLGGDPGFMVGSSIYWFQSDAVLNTRSGGTWTESVIAMDGNGVGRSNSNTWQDCSNAVSSKGFLVGLWASLVFDANNKVYLAWRNCHNGEFPQQDWAGSDVNLAEGPLNPSALTCVSQGGNNKQAWGGRIQLAMGPNNLPAMVYDQAFGGADTSGQNVIFQQRLADGSWTAPGDVMSIADTQSGASLAYDATEGWGIAVVDRTQSVLSYLKSADGTHWSSPDPVFGAGSGGWYPSLAMDPINHEPGVAFYVCSPRPGKLEGTCLASEDELRVSQRIAGNWRETVVDLEGGYGPKLGYFSSGKRFVVYRHPATGAVKLAVER